jgi:hypothetical protein
MTPRTLQLAVRDFLIWTVALWGIVGLVVLAFLFLDGMDKERFGTILIWSGAVILILGLPAEGGLLPNMSTWRGGGMTDQTAYKDGREPDFEPEPPGRLTAVGIALLVGGPMLLLGTLLI